MGKVYLIITCSINNKVGIKWAGRRRQEYFIGISNVLEHCREKDIIPIIVENSKDGSSFLDVFNCDKLYTNDNVFKDFQDTEYLEHKGQNEIRDIRAVIEKYNIEDDDMIIKHTGRYMLFQDDFFKLVLNNVNEKDAIFKGFNVCSYTEQDDDMVMGLFALKAKYFKEFEFKIFNLGCEQELRTYINDKVLPELILKTNVLYLRVCIGQDHKMVDV